MEQTAYTAENKRSPEETEAWILGSGTSSLASALYLIKNGKVPANNVHILDSHGSVGQILHQVGNPSSGYDQFAGCLPVPIGAPLKELLDSIPSVRVRGRSVLDEIQSAEVTRKSATKNCGTSFLVQKDHTFQNIPTHSLNLSIKHRLALVRLVLKGERRLGRGQIKDFLPSSFFQSTFWAIWSAHAIELTRALREYLCEFHSLAILSCLDITGYYQHESIYLPIYFYLRSLDVDFRFDIKVRDIETTPDNDHHTVSRLHLIQHGFEMHQDIGPHDIVIATLGSTVSGCTTGTHKYPPDLQSIEPAEQLDENWSLWLELRSRHSKFGNPYNFCTHQSQSILESFTITTEDLAFFKHLSSLSRFSSAAGIYVILRESRWRLNLCIPTQEVFRHQPPNVRILWGFALFPESKGDYVKKSMLHCSGAEIMSELLHHVNFPSELLARHTVLVPRVMPRMSSLLVGRSPDDRPQVIPQNTSNIGLVGQFVELPHYTSVDVSYGVRSAEMAVSQLMNLHMPSVVSKSSFSTLLKILLWS
ncbi:hypothetical protein N7532_002359 [Penicillium argentinense]|uniref:67 kDa myosin-cross-reactive antigen family protein n=1 Tax=Penicillium argentinense TaxID=1131581 RepID=A0A9W9G090_9EURO|nr:uncharacterized protein N7532_002359 [Penicillium argentinense]KAJ5109714.1 hypothetical protein N7532_002359 [Penicillium argentinense]